MPELVNITLDGEQYQVEKGVPLVLAAEKAGVRIPHLCFHEGLSVFAGCRLCVVQIDGARGFPTSCTTPTAEGQVIWTKTPEVLDMQRGVMSLIMADHPDRCLTCHRQEHCGISGICLRDAVVTYRCLTCAKNGRCEFQSTSEELEMHRAPMRYYQESHSWYGPEHHELPIKRDNPFIELDFNECILCARCVRVCDEVRGLSCYELTYKGPESHIGTSFDLPLQAVDCDACGACIDVCPVASIMDKPSKWQGNPQRTVTTTCNLCADGCSLDVEVKQEKVLRVSPNKQGPANHGVACARGRYGLTFVDDSNRLTAPLVRRDGRLTETTWEDALALVAQQLGQYRGDAVGAVGSPRATNEELYLLQKLTRQVLGSNNIDTYFDLDDRPALRGLAAALGYGATTNPMDDLSDAKCLFVIASDTSATHPIAAWQSRRAARFRGGSLIVAGPLETEMVGWANQWLRYKPGTEVALLAGMVRAIIDEGLMNAEFLQEQVELSGPLDALTMLTVEEAADITGVPADDIWQAARSYAAGPSAILFDAGITQYTTNQDAVKALADLALLTGNLGKPSTGVFALRSAANAQGADDMGCRPDCLPGYQPVTGASGLSARQMLAGSAGNLKALVVAGADPLADDPDRRAMAARLEGLEFLVVLDSSLTATAQAAQVVLPLTAITEQEGSLTNAERRIQQVQAVFDPLGQSRPGWQALQNIARHLDAKSFDFTNAAGVMDEIASVTPIYGGVSHARLEGEGLQWPCPAPEHPGTPVLYSDGFPGGKAKLQTINYVPNPAPDGFPLQLAVGRQLLPFHREVLTTREDAYTRSYSDDVLRVHPDDALHFDVGEGELVTIATPRATVRAKATITDTVPAGTAFITLPILEDNAPYQSGPLAELLEQSGIGPLSPARIEKNGR